MSNCSRCKQENNSPEYRMCVDCRLALRRYAQSRRDRHLCQCCGNNATKKYWCDDCYLRQLGYVEAYQERHQSQGLCLVCQNKAHTGQLYCDIHRQTNCQRQARYKARQARLVPLL